MTRGPHTDPGLLIEAAQKAVGRGDYSEAERLLREAAAIQEATLGGDHPDFATTLNNLAYVCEQTGSIDEAERGYRRAHKIAVASLSPGHPFIKTSLSSLMEFCEAHGIPIWTRPERPVEDEPLPDEIGVNTSSDRERVSADAGVESFGVEPIHVEAPPIEAAPIINEPAHAGRLPLRMMAVAAALVIVAAVVVVAFARRGNEANDDPRPVAYASTTTARLPPVAPAPAATVSSEGPAPAPPRAPDMSTAPPKPRPAPLNATASVTVLNAQLCRALAKRGSPDWQCTSAGSSGRPGIYTYYTRLLTRAGTTVEHRWYFRGRLHQRMRLRVSPNPVAGYRTFSTTTVRPERAGAWKVELRAADGMVLDEAQFVVR